MALVSLAAVAALAWLRLDLALLLVPLFCPLFMHPRAIGSRHVAPSEVFLVTDAAVAVLLLLMGRYRFEWRALVRSPFLLPAALLFIAGTLSTALAVDRHHALEYYRWTVLEPLIYFALLLLTRVPARTWLYLALAVLGAGVVSSVIGLDQWITGIGLSVPPGGGPRRVPGPYGSPDNLGLLLDRVIPLWLALVLLARVPSWRRWLWLLPGALFLVTLALTYSRGAWLAVPIGCLLVVVLAFPWGRWLLVAAVIVALLGVGLKESAIARAVNSGHNGTAAQRLNIWNSSLAMIRDHPLVGVGPDNFVHYYAPTRKQDRWQHECAAGVGYMQPGAGDEPCLSHPHNEFLDFWLSTGILGLLAFLWLELVFWVRAAGIWRRSRDVLTLGVMGAMAAGLAHGLVDNSYFLPDLAILFWLFCAYVGDPGRAGASIDHYKGPPRDAATPVAPDS